MVYGIVYKITNKINGKVYIGQTIQDMIKRWKSHCKPTDCIKLYRAIKKYGKDNFIIEELIKCYSKEELNLEETNLINKYNSIKNGYNIRPGGSTSKWNSDSVSKLKETIKNQKSRKGQFTKVIQYDLNLNKIKEYESITEAASAVNLHKSAIIACCSKRLSNKTAGGFIWSYANKIPAALKPWSGTTIIQYDKIGNKIAEFISISEAARITNIKRQRISNCCRGTAKSASGFKWRYK